MELNNYNNIQLKKNGMKIGGIKTKKLLNMVSHTHTKKKPFKSTETSK
jgi:hypothetical protein